MDDRFNKWLAWIFKWECVFDKHGNVIAEHDPDDPGGCTKYGLDQRSHPDLHIESLTKEQAAQIYWNDYWTRSKANLMPLGVGEVIGNIAVNAGIGRASKWLQKDVGVTVDGNIRPKTLTAVNAANPDMLANALLQVTEAHYRSIAKGKLAKFMGGWPNRNNDLRKFIASLSAQDP